MTVYIVILYPLPKIYLWTLKSIMKKSFVLLLLTIISISSQSTNRYSLLVVTIQDDNKTLFSIDSGEDLCQSTNKNPEHRYCWRTEDRRNRKCLSNGEGVLRQKSKETREATPYDQWISLLQGNLFTGWDWDWVDNGQEELAAALCTLEGWTIL